MALNTLKLVGTFFSPSFIPSLNLPENKKKYREFKISKFFDENESA